MTPKFDALQWTYGCGCGNSPTKAFSEVDKGAGAGLLIRHGNDDVFRVTQYMGGARVLDAAEMTPEQIESLL